MVCPFCTLAGYRLLYDDFTPPAIRHDAEDVDAGARERDAAVRAAIYALARGRKGFHFAEAVSEVGRAALHVGDGRGGEGRLVSRRGVLGKHGRKNHITRNRQPTGIVGIPVIPHFSK